MNSGDTIRISFRLMRLRRQQQSAHSASREGSNSFGPHRTPRGSATHPAGCDPPMPNQEAIVFAAAGEPGPARSTALRACPEPCRWGRLSGRNQDKLTQRHEATKTGSDRGISDSVISVALCESGIQPRRASQTPIFPWRSLRLCARQRSFSVQDFRQPIRRNWKSFSVVAGL